MKKQIIAGLLAGLLCASTAYANSSLFPEVPFKKNEIPSWLQDSRRLSKILDGEDIGEVSNTKVVGRYNTPISGLFAVAVEGTVTKSGSAPRQEYFIFYTDKDSKYLVAGMIIDIDNSRNITQMIEQQIRGNLATSPAKALNLSVMHAVQWNPGNEKKGQITLVIDIGPEGGKANFINVATLHQNLSKTKRVRPLRIIPVTNGKNELATAAMAMALGYETLRPGDGYNKLLEFADKGDAASWLQKNRLATDPKLKEILGVGAFKMEENTTFAMMAKVERLPLIYLHENGVPTPIPTPTSKAAWEKLLLQTK